MKKLCLLICCIAELAFSSVALSAVTDGLVAYYRFENDFLDSSGSSHVNNGTPVNGPGFTAGKLGQAMSLMGPHDYLTLDHTLFTDLDFGSTTDGSAADFSIAMWIKQANFLSDPAVLSNKDWDSGLNTGINWAVKGSQPFDLNTKADTGERLDLDQSTNSAPLLIGNWNLVIMTVDRNGPTNLYINGVQTGTIPISSQGDFNGPLPWNVGQDGTGNYAVEFSGAVDELAFWRRNLSPQEAEAIWNQGAGVDLLTLRYDDALKLLVDRDSGQMQIVNGTSDHQDIKAYSILSAAGAFDRFAWTTVKDHYDSAGTGVVDSENRWVVFTASTSAADLSEGSLGTGTIAQGAVVDLGTGVWGKYYEDERDVSFQYVDGTGAVVNGAVEFTGNQGAAFPFADLNFDGLLDADDWATLSDVFEQDLTSQSLAQLYRHGDLNGDGLHSLADILKFRQAYDAEHGSGSFDALTKQVPEPSSLECILVLLGCFVSVQSRIRDGAPRKWIAPLIVLLGLVEFSPVNASGATLFSEDFDDVSLGSTVDEEVFGTAVWSNSPPSGWSIDNSGVPTGGVTEWRGWAFADPAWWTATADDQGRSQFTKGTGVVAVADPDEWDDRSHDLGTYNTFLRTPAINLAGIPAGSGRLRFDSSWVPEDFQTATLSVSYDGGSAHQLFRWSSETSDPDFKPSAMNETFIIDLENPSGANDMVLSFGMVDAGNDWWWAIDNLAVFTPLALDIDVQTGLTTILGDASQQITGYEIGSPSGSLSPTGWLSGNLDFQNAAGTTLTADFNRDDAVNEGDLATWSAAYSATASADADHDGDTDGNDFLVWQQNHGTANPAEADWHTFLATDRQLIESYLSGSTTFLMDTQLGVAYDVVRDSRDLEFSYTTLAGELLDGIVTYSDATLEAKAIPEPSPWTLLTGTLLLAVRRRTLMPAKFTTFRSILRKSSAPLRVAAREWLRLATTMTVSSTS